MTKKRRPAETEREWWTFLMSDDTSFIRSMEDWKKAISNPKSNPLNGCDAASIAHFTKNLKFNRGGLAHANFGQVGRQLTYFQFQALWWRFGLGMGLFADYQNKECSKRATCSTSMADVCTSNC